MADDLAVDPLGALQWHWGEAYIITSPEPDVWIAERRDTHETLREGNPFTLRDKILADYLACPVDRPALRKLPRAGVSPARRLNARR
jgi:hypothetical protein